MPGGTIAVGMFGGGPDNGRFGGIACQPYTQNTLVVVVVVYHVTIVAIVHGLFFHVSIRRSHSMLF